MRATLVGGLGIQAGWVWLLLDETNRIQAEMRIGPRLDQPRRFLNRFTEPDIFHGHAEQLAAHPVIFHDAEAKVHRVKRTGGDSLVAESLQIGKWK
jgi:hypothetical protein